MAGPRDDLVNRAGKNDLSQGLRALTIEAFPPKAPDRLLGADELTREIDVDDLSPIVQGHFRESGVLLQSCVGDDDVNPAQLQLRCFKQACAAFRFG